MRSSGITIYVPRLFSHISALSAESKSYINTFRFNIDEMFQLDPLDLEKVFFRLRIWEGTRK